MASLINESFFNFISHDNSSSQNDEIREHEWLATKIQDANKENHDLNRGVEKRWSERKLNASSPNEAFTEEVPSSIVQGLEKTTKLERRTSKSTVKVRRKTIKPSRAFNELRKKLDADLQNREDKKRRVGGKTYLRLGDGPAGVGGALKRPEPFFDPNTGRFAVALLQKSNAHVSDPEANLRREITILEKLKDGPFVPMLGHGNIIAPNHPEEEGTFAFIMGKMHEDFSSAMATGRITQEQNPLILAKGIGESIKNLHEKGLIHRDLKPDNLLVSWNDEAHTQLKEVRVSDFDQAADYENFPDEEEELLVQLSDLSFGGLDYWSWTPEEIVLRVNGSRIGKEFIDLYELNGDISLAEQKKSLLQALQQQDMFTLGKVFFEALTNNNKLLDLVHPTAYDEENWEAVRQLDVDKVSRLIATGLERSSLNTRQREAYTELVMGCLELEPTLRTTSAEFYDKVLEIEGMK